MALITTVEINHSLSAGVIPVDGEKMMPAASQPKQVVLSKAAQRLLDIETEYTVGGFTPLPGFFERGLGSVLWVRIYQSAQECVIAVHELTDFILGC